MTPTPYGIAERYIGIREVPGSSVNPMIMKMLNLDQTWPDDDEVPWCSAFINWIHWILRLPRSKSLRARSWLQVGTPVFTPRRGDIVILSRGGGDQPGPEVIDAPGHVGFVSSVTPSVVYVLGGNQSDSVCISAYDARRVLGYRRIEWGVPE